MRIHLITLPEALFVQGIHFSQAWITRCCWYFLYYRTTICIYSLIFLCCWKICSNLIMFNFVISFCEKLHDVLGFDWLLMFLCGHVHKDTVKRSSRILFLVLSHVVSLNSFKNGTSNGGWLKETRLVTSRRVKIAAGMILHFLLTFSILFHIFMIIRV